MTNKRLTIDIDEKLHRDFKSVAAQYGVTMKDLMMSFIMEITTLKLTMPCYFLLLRKVQKRFGFCTFWMYIYFKAMKRTLLYSNDASFNLDFHRGLCLHKPQHPSLGKAERWIRNLLE